MIIMRVMDASAQPDFKHQQASLDNVLFELEMRGLRFFDSKLQLSNFVCAAPFVLLFLVRAHIQSLLSPSLSFPLSLSLSLPLSLFSPFTHPPTCPHFPCILEGVAPPVCSSPRLAEAECKPRGLLLKQHPKRLWQPLQQPIKARICSAPRQPQAFRCI